MIKQSTKSIRNTKRPQKRPLERYSKRRGQ